MPLTIYNPEASPKDVIETIRKDGCVAIRGLAPSGLMNEMDSELDPHFDQTPSDAGYFTGFHTRRTGAIIAKSKASWELATNPLIFAAMSAVLGPHCERFQLYLAQGIRIDPGETAQVLHRDDGMFPHDHVPDDCMVNVQWANSDFTRQNGATQLVPGSHRWANDRLPTPEEVVYAEVPRGSAIIWVGSLLHGGGANQSNGPRTAYTMGYNLGWLNQEEERHLAVPSERAKDLPPDLQRLIGYTAHIPKLGPLECNDLQNLQGQDGNHPSAVKASLPEDIGFAREA